MNKMSRWMDSSIAFSIGLLLLLTSFIIGDPIYVGAWYYLLAWLGLVGIVQIAKAPPLFTAGAALALAASFLFYWTWQASLPQPEGLLGLGHSSRYRTPASDASLGSICLWPTGLRHRIYHCPVGCMPVHAVLWLTVSMAALIIHSSRRCFAARLNSGVRPHMKSHQLQLFADYYQFYIQDEAADGDLSDAWSQDAVQRMLSVSEGVVGIGTVRNMEVPVTIEFLDSEPPINLTIFDHVVEGSLVVAQGPVVVAGCTDYFPDATRFDLTPGTYRVRLSASGFDTISEDGLDGQDHYLVQLWQAPSIEPTVLKQGTI